MYESEPRVLEVKYAAVNSVAVVCDGDNDYEISRSTWAPPQSINSTDAQKENRSPVNEKPLVSSRFSHRKPLKASPEGTYIQLFIFRITFFFYFVKIVISFD